MSIGTRRICACPDLLGAGADLWEEKEEGWARGGRAPIFGEVVLVLMGKSSFSAHGNNAFLASWFFSGAPRTTRSGSWVALNALPQFPHRCLGIWLLPCNSPKPPMGMSGHHPRSPRRGEKKKNPSGNGTILPSNPTACFPQSRVGAIPILVLDWSIFTPWSSPAPCSHVLPLAVILWKHRDLLLIPGVSLPPRARPHACLGHFKSPFQPGTPHAEGLAGTTKSADVSVTDWQGQDTDPRSPLDALHHAG